MMERNWYEDKVEAVFGDSLLYVVIVETVGGGAWVSVDAGSRRCSDPFFVRKCEFTAFLDAVRIAYNLGIGLSRFREREIPKIKE